MKSTESHTKQSSTSSASTKTNGGGISLPSIPVLQQKENSLEEPIQEFSTIQQKSVKQFASGAEDTSNIKPFQLKPNNTGLPDNLKSGVENLSGMSMDHVKVHYNSSQPAQLNALAYAQGSEIHVGPGQEKHLPHEAWHVVQQAQGRVQATKQMKMGVAVNDDPALEHEADVMGERALNIVDSGHISVAQSKRSEIENNVVDSYQLKTTQVTETGVSINLISPVTQLQKHENSVEDSTEKPSEPLANKSGEESETDVEDVDVMSLLERFSLFVESDAEGGNESPEISVEEEEDIIEGNSDSSEEIQLVSMGVVLQAMRGLMDQSSKSYYLNKLAFSGRLLIKTLKLIENGAVRLRDPKERFKIEQSLEETRIYYARLKNSKFKKVSLETQRLLDKKIFMNNRIPFRIRKELIYKERKDQFMSKTNEAEVNRKVVNDWYDEIGKKNSRILDIINESTNAGNVTDHPWFLMDYEEIIDGQAELADKVIEISFSELNDLHDGDLETMRNQMLQHIKVKRYYLPLVYFQEPKITQQFGNNVICVAYDINPSYTKFMDPTKVGDGSQAIQILGDHGDSKIKTDIRFIPGNLTLGDQTSQVGKQMEAVKLSQDHPLGSEAGKDSSQDKLMGNLQKTMGDKKTKYIKGHLLNDHVGGPARTYNLFPITDQANNDHLVFMEKYVKAEIEKGYVMYYKVEIKNVNVTDQVPLKLTHDRRYTVNSDIVCESAKWDKTDNKVEQHAITVKSVWSGGEVLDSLGQRIRRGSDLSLLGSPLSSHSDYTRKLKSGTPNEGVTNPDVKDPDSSVHKIYNKTGYKQDGMEKGKLSDSDFDSTTIGAIPFTISGSIGDLSTATQASVATVVGKHIAGLIWSSGFIVLGKLKAGITELELLSIKGVGPITIAKLKKNFTIA